MITDISSKGKVFMELEFDALNINGFVFEVQRIPIVKFGCQSVSFPGMSLSEVEQPNPFTAIPVPGDHVVFDDLTFTFMVDKKMRNYLAIQHWMNALAFPEKHEQFKDFVQGHSDNKDIEFFFSTERLNQYSDVTITILTNQKNPQFRWRLVDAHPTHLSGFETSVTESTSSPIIATCVMKFSHMVIEPA